MSNILFDVKDVKNRLTTLESRLNTQLGQKDSISSILTELQNSIKTLNDEIKTIKKKIISLEKTKTTE